LCGCSNTSGSDPQQPLIHARFEENGLGKNIPLDCDTFNGHHYRHQTATFLFDERSFLPQHWQSMLLRLPISLCSFTERVVDSRPGQAIETHWPSNATITTFEAGTFISG
jgi:hypothetical protein